jgi:hypothetical protein
MFYGFPDQNGVPGGVKVAMHFKKSAEGRGTAVCTPDSINRTVSDDEIEEVRWRLKAVVELMYVSTASEVARSS